MSRTAAAPDPSRIDPWDAIAKRGGYTTEAIARAAARHRERTERQNADEAQGDAMRSWLARIVEPVTPIKPDATTSVQQIIESTALRHGVSAHDITGHRKSARLIAARHDAISEAYQKRPDLSLPQLGRAFNRDHTTILHVVRRRGVWK